MEAPSRVRRRANGERACDRDDGRFHCPFPGCGRSCAELWRLKVHYRAPADNKGSGVERGHGAELDRCPRCLGKLEPGRHHVGCRSGLAAPRQALKRERSMRRARVRRESRSLDASSSSGTEQEGSDAGQSEAARDLEQMLAAEATRLQPLVLRPGSHCGGDSGASQGGHTASSLRGAFHLGSLPGTGFAGSHWQSCSSLGGAIQLRRSASLHSDASRCEQLPALQLGLAALGPGPCCEVEEDEEVLIPRSFAPALALAPPLRPLARPPPLQPPALLTPAACQMRVWRLTDGRAQPQLLSPQTFGPSSMQ